ncbi:transposase [Micromonospora sp. Rc5]|uniref:transposase n=1 Tax=unclassified Micromonospora TaxID=2617518 RepID=UPI00118201A0
MTCTAQISTVRPIEPPFILSTSDRTGHRCILAFPLRCGYPETGCCFRARVSPLWRPSKYTEEFQRDAVDLVRSSGRSFNQVARELGISHETLRN